MSRRSRIVWLAASAAIALGGVVAAQPTPQPSAGAQAPPAAPAAAVAPEPALEEAPPITVVTPPPAVTPPIGEEEVAPISPKEETEAAKPPEPPQRRARYDVAVLQVLDKVTAETLRFEAAVGKPVRYKTLIFTVRACERTAPDEPIEDSVGYLEVQSQPRAGPGRPGPPPRQTFKGWMYASSPGLHPLEHPVYDAWLITCRAAAPPVKPTVAAR